MTSENYTEAKVLDEKEDLEALLRDGLENLISNMGTGADPRSHSTFVNSKRLSQEGNQDELNALYRTNWIAGKVVDILPDDMTREWREFDGEIPPETIDLLVGEEDRLDLSNTFNKAHKFSRLYGTAVIIMDVDDGQTPDKPLNMDAIKEGGLRHIKAVDRVRFNSAEMEIIDDPLNPNYGLPEFYRFTGSRSNAKIHHSRLIRFDAVELPFDEFIRNNYNSDSVLDRIYDDIINLTTVLSASASMVHETNTDIMKVKGLMSHLATKEGEERLRKRFALAKMMKSFNNMTLLDNEEDIQTKTNTFSGLEALIDRYAQIISAASDVPATRLLGTSASGLNATGEGDLKNYYDKVRSLQKTTYKDKLDYFDKIMAKSLGISDEDLSYTFVSLFQMTPKEEADVSLVEAQRDSIYLDQGVVNEEIVAKDLKQKGTYSNLTDEHIKEIEEAASDFGSDIPEELIEGIESEEEPEENEEDETGTGSEES